MANAFYTKFFEALMAGNIDLDADDIYVVLVDGDDYAPNMATDDDLDDIPVEARIATAGPLANKSVANGVFDANDLEFPAVSGDEFEYIALYVLKGSPVVTYLIMLIGSATGLPCTPNGGDITIQWSNGANRIFRLG